MTLAEQIAQDILRSFSNYRAHFQRITEGARTRFEMADWQAVQRAAAERINLYESMCQDAAETLQRKIKKDLHDSELWRHAKLAYIQLITQRDDFELAETYYNSIYCRVYARRQLDDLHMFIHSSMAGRIVQSGEQIYRTYDLSNGVQNMLSRILDDVAFAIPWENKRRDIRNILRYVRNNLTEQFENPADTRIEVVKSVFYRNKGAYIVGRVCTDHKQLPFVLPVLNNEAGGVYVDTLITEENDVSVIFSFTRAYFMADVNVPSEFVRFMQSILPMKSVAEIYSSVGFYKQGKAEFYRNFVEHLKNSDDSFVIAPGIKGMVMTVFTQPSYPLVFKIIKDSFSSSKYISRSTVIEKYQLVKRHDRVGRMADTMEFTNFSFPRDRFSDELIDELQRVAASSVEVRDDVVLIRHLWTERRMTPLNIHINEALAKKDEYAVFHAINEFGKCIKQLAAANIFAGDMLFKNFGITRHGRVVFYDYDEIMYLTECNFREIPEAIYPEQEMMDEPWYSVGPCDVFPEELRMLTRCDRTVRRIFNELHQDLLDVAFWREMQAQVQAGDVMDVFPYRKVKRFLRN
ncbi:bifunctional isocitrate dehydrogenase kinase/phosphatase [Pontibacterium sp.]|uniref:bifunctional isocitrate dehydrogenase kinase/phosphatase n=1 Tax=Pontibacterium sp. TaxID=2036026 RepID=UPI0035120A27